MTYQMHQTQKLTPALAATLYDACPLKRGLNEAHISWLAQQIAEGNWRYSLDTIQIARDGTVVDGQHRLKAVIKAKKSITIRILEEAN